MMGWIPRCYIPGFVEIGLSVLEKISKGFFTIYGHGSHLGYVTSIKSSDFHSLYLKAFKQSLVQFSTVVSQKIQFKFLYVHNFGPRSRNSLDLQYSNIFIYSIRCLFLLTFRSLAAIVSDKSTIFTFSYRKA